MQNDLDPKGYDPKLAGALASLVKRLEAMPEGLRGPFLVKGLKPYLSAVPDGEGGNERLREQGVEVLRRLSSAKVSLSDASFIAGWVTEARAALAASRLSQAGVRVTDEMVDIAFRAHTKASGLKLDPGAGYKYQRTAMRAALEAALGDTL